MVLSIVSLGFTACGDDEEGQDYASEIKGTYNGSLTFAGTETPFDNNAQIIVDRKDNSNVILKMNEEIMGLAIDVACTSKITYTDGTYSVSGTTTYSMKPEGSPVAIPVPITITGSFDKKNNTTLNISVGIPQNNLNVVFEGSKK